MTKPKELVAKWPLNKNFNLEGWNGFKFLQNICWKGMKKPDVQGVPSSVIYKQVMHMQCNMDIKLG